MAPLASKSRQDSKTGSCQICGQVTTKYCNSHSVPVSVLKNIGGKEGELITHAKLIDIPILESEVGLNKAGRFFRICRSCDSKVLRSWLNMTL